jgi:hypothetical protein
MTWCDLSESTIYLCFLIIFPESPADQKFCIVLGFFWSFPKNDNFNGSLLDLKYLGKYLGKYLVMKHHIVL